MNCPKCASRLTVIDSRAFSNNRTKRRLACEICGERFTSVEKIMTEEEINAPAVTVTATATATAINNADVATQPTIDLDEVFAAMAENAVVRNGFISAITGGIYESEEAALKDSIKELNRLYNERF